MSVRSLSRKVVAMQFSDWLKDQLERRPDLNQMILADHIGINASTVSHWVKGRSKPRPEHIAGLAQLFGVPASTLYLILGYPMGEDYPFNPIVQALFEEIDKEIEETKDAGDRALLIEQLRDQLQAIRHLRERLHQRRGDKDE